MVNADHSKSIILDATSHFYDSRISIIMTNRKRKLGTGADDNSHPAPKRAKKGADDNPIFRVPQHLKNSVTQISRNKTECVFALKLPLGSMDSIRKMAWGIKDSASSVGIRVRFHNSEKGTFVSYCVHNSGDKIPTSGHRYCSTKDATANKVICTTRPNLLTCVLARDLHELLRTKDTTVAQIHQKMEQAIDSDPTEKCLICRKKFNVRMWAATTCSDKCAKEFEAWPLTARAAHLTLDTKTLDFLLCCVYSDALLKEKYQYQEVYPNLLKDCPVSIRQLTSVIDSFPEDLSKVMSPPDSHSTKQMGLYRERQQLLSWICSSFRGFMTFLPPAADFHAPEMGKSHQFLLMNAHLGRQKAFVNKVNSLEKGVGSMAFHGTPSYNTLSILREGLKANHIGLFYAPEPSTSLSYSGQVANDGYLQPWTKSSFKGQQYLVLFGCEVALRDVPWAWGEHSTSDESTVMIRYIFLCPVNIAPPLASTLSNTMLTTYASLQKGQVAKCDIKG